MYYCYFWSCFQGLHIANSFFCKETVKNFAFDNMSVSLDSVHFWKALSSGIHTISSSTTRQFKIRYSQSCQLSLNKARELRMSSVYV